MTQVKVTIDEMSNYTIEFKEEYSINDFILVIEGHMSKLRRLIPTEEKHITTGFHKNDLFNELSPLIEGLGDDVIIKDNPTMRTFKSIDKSTNKEVGLAWLQPSGKSLIIYLRKGDYKSIDHKRMIVYSREKHKTFGEYPMIKTNKSADINYVFDIIKNIYNKSWSSPSFLERNLWHMANQ
jgi:hypothetical protein